MRMPAIVIGHHGYRYVAEFSFAGEFGFLQVGHANDVHAEAAIDIRFRLGGELRTFHAEVGPATFSDDSRSPAGMCNDASEFGAHRIGKGNVGDDAIAEERVDAMARTIEELVGNDELQRLMFFLEGANG